jgi:glycerol-3-phosphate dehydrogenase
MDSYDLLVVGGGINGAGVARDAAGRGLSVLLCEMNDLGSATSSASSKLIHGGLRYLEHYEFRLVAEALAEREVLLRCAPHLVRPMRFVMPHVPSLRPAWMIRAGLFLYDYLARRQTLPGSHRVDLREAPYNAGLKPGLSTGFAYSDCGVDDARLVILNALAAARHGARIATHTMCTAAARAGGRWHAKLRDAAGMESDVYAKAIVNVSGPWARKFLTEAVRQPAAFNLKLVQGSHIIVPRLYDGEHAFILQNEDRRVVFVYPYEGSYTLIGTTELEFSGEPGPCQASEQEVAYLCRAANRYFVRQLAPRDVVWRYAGLRPLFDDGASDPSAITRDYVLRIDGGRNEAPILSVFGGKITTYRRLAERVLDALAPWFPAARGAWTANAPLPGAEPRGAGEAHGCDDALLRRYAGLPRGIVAGLLRRHGTLIEDVLGEARSVDDLGDHLGADLYAREVDYFISREWARTGEDVLWRRTKCGLHLTAAERQVVKNYVGQRVH